MTRNGVSFAVPRPGWRALVAGVLAVVVIGVLIVARLRGGSGSPSAAPPSGSSAASAAAPSASASPSADDGAEGAAEKPYDQPAAPAALAAARAFVAAWADHPDGVTQATWWKRVAKHADPVLAKQLESTDPQRVPATKITGAARGISGGATNATVAVPTDAGEVVLTCVLVGGAWRVSDLDLNRPPA